MTTPRLPRTPALFWLEWRHFYSDNDLDVPQVVMKDHAVFDLNFAAYDRRVEIGMSLHQLRPLAPGCLVQPWKPEPAKSKTWLDACLPYSDRIEPRADHIALLDLTAHPDPFDIARRLVRRLDELPFGRLVYGLGPAVWIAQLMALRKCPLEPIRDLAQTLAPLPLENLRCLPLPHRQRLRLLGYRTIGQVATIPPAVLRQQFGQDAQTILLAARGESRDVVRPLYPSGAVHDVVRFDGALDDSLAVQDAIETLARRLAAKLFNRQATEATLVFEFEDAPVKTVSRPLKHPAHDPAGVRAAFLSLAQNLLPAQNPVTLVSARLENLEPCRPKQQNLFLARESTPQYNNSADSPDAKLKLLQSAFGHTSVRRATELKITRRDQVLKEWKNATGWR